MLSIIMRTRLSKCCFAFVALNSLATVNNGHRRHFIFRKTTNIFTMEGDRVFDIMHLEHVLTQQTIIFGRFEFSHGIIVFSRSR